MTERPGPADDPEAALLGTEEIALENSVQSVGGRRGRGPVVAGVLIVAAFAIGLVRPWDWLGPGQAALPQGEGQVVSAAPGRSPGEPGAAGVPGESTVPGGPDDEPPPTCAFPLDWRAATLQSWAGRPARVWSAVHVAEASGPNDPAIPFQMVFGQDFTALGWCAPVEGVERPPQTARGTLFRVEDGVALEVPFDRLEPIEPDSLGELWAPPAGPDGRHPEWEPGRYVIRLGSTTGSYVRYLGLELGLARLPVPHSPGPDPSPSSSATAAP